MITRRETCFVITIVVLGIVSALHCPSDFISTNQECTCEPSYDGTIEINCFMKNEEASFIVTIQEDNHVKIDCVNSPKWSDFDLDVSLPETENIRVMYFHMCDLPTNKSLSAIARMLGVTGLERLVFQSYKNLSFALSKYHLDDLENLQYLILSSNNVSYVDEDLLDGLVNLTGLNLRDNNLHLTTGFFNYTPRLNWLELGDNALQSIEPGTFDNLKNLTFLNLWRNHFIELQSGIFDKLIALKTLGLNTNYIVKLPEDIFAKLENLEVLNLSQNNFTQNSLPRNLLQNNTKLRTISLYENKRNMTTLPNAFFANLTKLEELKLRRNGFITLPEDLFWGCTSLTNITLERNYLQTLPAGIFRDLKELKKLDLNFNDLETLPDNIFLNTRLVKLDLSKNRITFISDHLFDGLHDLEELNMEENRLTTISNYGLNSLTRLKIAKFSNNYLTLQNVYNHSDKFGALTPFSYCILLEELYLDHNNISKIFSDWVMSDVKLKKLDLKYNNISSININDLQFVSADVEVDLTHNQIEHILLDNAESYMVPQGERKRDTIILVDDNPLHCDCELYEFLRYIEGRMHPDVQAYFHIILGNLTCQSPKELENVLVTDLKSKSLTCAITEPDVCREKCKCSVRPHDRTFIFDCSHKNLTSVPSDMKKADGFHQYELNFSGNQLTSMPDLNVIGFESVKKLILSQNNISEISLDGLSSTIKVLELHNNCLTRIHPDVLKFLKQSTNLTRLTLHENPWKCDCDATDFRNFIHTEFVMMPDLLRVKCPGRNISISEMTLNDFCPLNTATIIGISIAISLTGFLVGLFGLLYYKYQRQIKVWLFAHRCCLWFVTEEELDKEKLYDAFVSYSHKDHDFVVDELVPKLENGSTPFKLCLHYRDWVAGEWIPANIASSVENSRRTIVVLSPNFLESVWGRMEFRAAHSQALSEGRARVILILYGDIGSTDNLDPELQAYISMNTYVKWGDPWFWDKLRYALPHQSKLVTNNAAGKKIFENHQLCIQTNGDKKELINPIGFAETPPQSTTPPADTLKKFICDESKEQLFNGYPQESCKLNENIAIILSPEHLMKYNTDEFLV